MSDVEQRLRQGLNDRAWEVAAPADPVGWVRERVARDRRRRAVMAPAAVALALAGLVGGSALLTGSAEDRTPDTAQEAAPLLKTVERDGLTLTLRLDDGTPKVGQRVVGEFIVTNRRAEDVQVRSACGNLPSFNVSYRSLLQPVGDREGLSQPAREFIDAVLLDRPEAQRRGWFSFAPRDYQLLDATGPCPEEEMDRTLRPGQSLSRPLVWQAQVPGAAATNGSLPVTAGISYVLPPGPDGQQPAGDPTSRGSTTPNGRMLLLETEVAVAAGDADRPSLPEVVAAAVTDERFADVLGRVPSRQWRFAWALPVDQPDTTQGVTFSNEDTDPAFGPVGTWYVTLVYYDNDVEPQRVTALVDGRSGRVVDVQQRPEGQ